MLEISPNALVSFKEEAAKRIKSYFGKKIFFFQSVSSTLEKYSSSFINFHLELS